MKHSFDEILLEYGPSVSRIVSSYAPPGPGREELLQDAWLAIWRALPGFRGESSLRTYVLRIAHNRGTTWLVRCRPVEFMDDDSVVDDRAGPEETASGRQEVQQLMQAIRTLPVGQRQVLSLTLEGLSHREVGTVLGLGENAVAVRLHRARQAVRLAMGED